MMGESFPNSNNITKMGLFEYKNQAMPQIPFIEDLQNVL